jgi:hypothetical protein
MQDSMIAAFGEEKFLAQLKEIDNAIQDLLAERRIIEPLALLAMQDLIDARIENHLIEIETEKIQ